MIASVRMKKIIYSELEKINFKDKIKISLLL